MYCNNCGREIDDKANVCPNCGVKPEKRNVIVEDEHSSTVGWGVLSFFIPIVGLILYLLWQDSRPRAAKTSGKCALISVIVRVGLGVVYAIIYVIAVVSIINGTI